MSNSVRLLIAFRVCIVSHSYWEVFWKIGVLKKQLVYKTLSSISGQSSWYTFEEVYFSYSITNLMKNEIHLALKNISAYNLNQSRYFIFKIKSLTFEAPYRRLVFCNHWTSWSTTYSMQDIIKVKNLNIEVSHCSTPTLFNEFWYFQFT